LFSAAAIWTLVGMTKCKNGNAFVGVVTRDHPVSNNAATFYNPHSFLFSKQTNLFYVLTASMVSVDDATSSQFSGSGTATSTAVVMGMSASGVAQHSCWLCRSTTVFDLFVRSVRW